MKKSTSVLTARLCIAAGLVGMMISVPVMAPAQAQHTTVRTTEDFDFTIPSCSGELVHVYGPIDIDTQTTINANGTTVDMHFTPHLTGVGLVSGLVYTAVGPAHIIYHLGNGASTTGFVNVTQLIGPGSVPNLHLVEVGHVTVNANGMTTVSFDDLKGGCQN
jgi:hypothetical protein